MVDSLHVARRSPVLTTSGLACLSNIPTINLTAGCANGCIYCYTLGYASRPRGAAAIVYTNVVDKLKAELAHAKSRPQAVYFSSSSDLFQPIPDVLALGYQVLKLLFSEGINVTILTKGRIPANSLELLLAHGTMVRVTIGLTSLEEEVARVFEPEAASPAERLQQMAQLVAGGVQTGARVDPILPGITDEQASLRRLFASLHQVGVQHAAVGTLFLRPLILQSLQKRLHGTALLNSLLTFYEDARRIPIRAHGSSVIALPLETRREIFERVRLAAEEAGVRVSVCACKNSDIARGTCGISGQWRRSRAPIQGRLLGGEG